MAGTHDALHLLTLASAQLFQDIGGLIGVLDQIPPGMAVADPDVERTALAAARVLAGRLKLRQAAWTQDPQAVPLARVAALGRGLPDEVTLDISMLEAGLVFPAASGRIVLNLLLLAADSLPAGGILTLAGSADDLFIRIDGRGAAWPPGTALYLADETEARSALTEGRALQSAFTALLAHASGIRLSLLLSTAAQGQPAILRLGGG